MGPKPVLNNKITYPNVYGRIVKHDSLLNQGVRTNSSPTFSNLVLTGDLSVLGRTFILNTNLTQYENNIVLINKTDTGPGVSLNLSGFEINRGTLENYRAVYDEFSKTFRIGLVSDTRAVATREDTPLAGGIMIWNTSGNIISTNSVPNSTTFSNRVFANGGVSFINSGINYTNGNLEISSSIGGIALKPVTEVVIPENKPLKFGDNVSLKNSGGNLQITTNLSNDVGVILDSSYLKMVQSTGNVSLSIISDGSLQVSSSNKNIIFQDGASLLFEKNGYLNSTTNGSKIGSSDGNLTLSAYSDINLQLLTRGNVNLRFGTAGSEYISGNATTAELELGAGGAVRVKQDMPLTFGATGTLSESIRGTTDKRLVIDSAAGVIFNNTSGSNSVDSGSVVLKGGLGVNKNVIMGGNLHVSGNVYVGGTTSYVNTETVVVENNLVISNNAGPTGVDGGLLIRRDISAVVATPNLAYAGIFYKESSGRMTFGYIGNTTSNITITEMTPIEAKGLTLTSTDNVSGNINNPVGSFVTNGGGAVKRDLWVGGLITAGSLATGNITSSTALITNITTDNITVTSNLKINSVDEVQNLTTASLVLPGGVGIAKGLQVGGVLQILKDDQATSLTSGGAFVVDGGVRVAKNTYIGGNAVVNGTSTIGGLSVNGTANISNNLTVMGETNLLGTLHLGSTSLDFGSSSFQTITNTSGSLAWYYVGVLNTSGTFSTQFSLTCQKTSFDIAISKSGSGQPLVVDYSSKIPQTGTGQTEAIVYTDGSNNPRLFVKVPPNQFANLYFVLHDDSNTVLGGKFEGTGAVPDGSLSGYAGSWTNSFSTKTAKTNLEYNIGNIRSMGDTAHFGDNLPIIGKDKTSSKDSSGYVLQRYQTENDTALGDVVADSVYESGVIPAQLVLDPESPNPIAETQIILGNWANSVNGYYTGHWIRVMTGSGAGQVRKIASYSGGLRVANLVTKWSPGKIPQLGDTIRIYNRNYIIHHFNESDGAIKTEWAIYDETTRDLKISGDVPVLLGNITIRDTTVSSNNSTGALVVPGGISIRCSTDSTSATSGGGLTVAGGVAVEKGLYISDRLTVSRQSFTHANNMYIKSSVGSFVFDHSVGNSSYIQFKSSADSNFAGYNILADSADNLLKIVAGTGAGTGTTGFVMTSSGNIGIKTTNNTSIGSALTLGVNNIISADSQNGYIGISPLSAPGNNSPSVLLWGNSSGNGTAGNLELSTGVSGNFQIKTNSTGRIIVNSSGSTLFTLNTESTNSSSGAVVMNGGVSINNTTNATNATRGGGLTVAGGASVAKDLYVGGDVYIGDELFYSSQNSVQRPTLTFSNSVNCSVVDYSDSSLLYIYTEGIFSVSIRVLPATDGTPCQFELDIPNRVSVFANRNDIKGFVSGYTDDTNVIPIFNTVCVAQPSTKRALVKFHSASNAVHYITLLCRYAIV